MTDDEESVGPARPMRPWRWDAVAFKAFQGNTEDERMTLLSVLQQHGLAQSLMHPYHPMPSGLRTYPYNMPNVGHRNGGTSLFGF